MNPLAQLHTQSLADLENLLDRPTFQWLGSTYPCVPSTLERGTMIDWGGQLVAIKFAIKVRTCVIRGAAKPLEAGKVITFDSVLYRIATAALSSAGDHLKLTLIDPNA